MLNWPIIGQGYFKRVAVLVRTLSNPEWYDASHIPPALVGVKSDMGMVWHDLEHFGLLARTPSVTDAVYAYQDIADPKTFRRATVTLKGWMCCRYASSARIAVSDGTTTTYSSYHTGSWAWEEFTVTHLVSNACSKLQARIYLEGTEDSPAVYVQGFSFTSSPRYEYGQLTAYEIIELLVQAIGGTLTYESRSSKATSFYPCLDVKSGQTAASVLNMILDIIPDKIRWYGNDAVMYYPQATDSPVYYYRGPS